MRKRSDALTGLQLADQRMITSLFNCSVLGFRLSDPGNQMRYEERQRNGIKLSKSGGQLPIANRSLLIILQGVWPSLPAKQLAMTDWQWAMA